MQNFIGTEYENMTEEEIFLLNEKLVKATIRKKFPNYQAYCQVHMIELDDLIQQGSIGLLNAIRTYENNSGSSFRSYAINNIAWYIQVNTRKESLRTINTRSSEVANIVSENTRIAGDEGEEITILDTLQAKNDTSVEAESEVMIERLEKLISQDESVNEELRYILIARLRGQTMQSIAEQLNIHRNAVQQRLSSKKAQRIKNRIASYLKNGEY